MELRWKTIRTGCLFDLMKGEFAETFSVEGVNDLVNLFVYAQKGTEYEPIAVFELAFTEGKEPALMLCNLFLKTGFICVADLALAGLASPDNDEVIKGFLMEVPSGAIRLGKSVPNAIEHYLFGRDFDRKAEAVAAYSGFATGEQLDATTEELAELMQAYRKFAKLKSTSIVVDPDNNRVTDYLTGEFIAPLR